MMASVDSPDVERFRGIIAARLGLNFDDSKLAFLADVMKRRGDATGQSPAAYLGRFESQGHAREELRALAVDLTVNETYFFRNPDQFRAMIHNVLPVRLAARAGQREICVLSAGCASGEEAYSLAILFRENAPDPSWTISIRAVDINPAMLEKARRARYSAWSLRETQPDVQHRWFSRDGTDFVLDRAIRGAVAFEERNLVDDDPELWKPETYDAIFCRNVIMYLTPDKARAAVRHMMRSLVPGGYLFLGHAETLRGLSQDFHLEHTHGTFYYRCRTPAERLRQHRDHSFASAATSSLEILPALVEDGATWVDAIRRASERIQTLSDASLAPRHDDKPPSRPAQAAGHRERLLDLLGRERFDDALAYAQSLPAESSADPDALLLRAALLAHAGQFERAEAACKELLQIDEMNAGAHYLLALCAEGSGAAAASAEHDRVAVYLDPAFAMPRLHLGLLQRRAGNRAAARIEFGHALTLLQQEDSLRLLLFGGGFGREALIALCRAEFIACGGQS
jgi:chemotaxis protein methyltransferase CheR